MESTLFLTEFQDVRSVMKPLSAPQTTSDYQTLTQSLQDNVRLNEQFLPIQLGPSFAERIQLEKAIFSYPNRLPGLETASIAKDIVNGTDDDMTLADDFPTVSYVLPTFSVHEQVEQLYL
ncbi:hypothetical protein ENUP19_0254G0006 [Entamoeba nuttalli]|uniref:Uncharacterized protein n=2 Tax=Entamoeba nuttalli TaxID=412467 RepID=K2G3W8_ENTNP|nr:hypothetical protein ENU1_213060 [Entamoeba nuttalli P19]EKE36986.1 hypothetical protein ENU1_213060 [Entamoeba nuttalli P19]|eukprot:XP_008860681.1 hypothetical protein ENU1_213060 [Entamoeba nuttalli P19]